MEAGMMWGGKGKPTETYTCGQWSKAELAFLYTKTQENLWVFVSEGDAEGERTKKEGNLSKFYRRDKCACIKSYVLQIFYVIRKM